MPAEINEELAKQIYQTSLDRICDAYFSNDFDAFLAHMHVPHSYTTQDGTQHTITNQIQMREAFDCFRQYLTGLGITHFIRECTGAMFLCETKIIGGHVSEFLQNGTRVREPYDVMAVLELIDGAWGVVSSENALPNTSWQSQAFRHGAQKTNEPPDGAT